MPFTVRADAATIFSIFHEFGIAVDRVGRLTVISGITDSSIGAKMARKKDPTALGAIARVGLVLSRRASERIFLTNEGGDQIAITLVGVGENSVRIGIRAPLEWEITREERMKPAEIATELRRVG